MAQSDSWPKSWIKGLSFVYNAKSDDQLLETPIFSGITTYIRNLLFDYRNTLCTLLKIALEEDGPQKYAPTIENDIALLEKVDELKDFKELYSYFENFSMGNFSTI